jgi:excisionase family DNA binding protein
MAHGKLRLVYTVTEAAELLGLGRSTAYELAARGELPIVRLGRRVAVTRSTLTELLGVEPPLPYELKHARCLLADPPAATATVSIPQEQAGSPDAR